MSPRLREAVIRGDVAAGGLVLVMSGAVLGAVWLSGAGLLPGLLALALVPTGVALVWWARRAYGRLLGEVVRTWAGHDPGPSPVPWIADGVWRQRNRFDPELDAADELRSQIDRSVRPFRDAAQGAFESPTLRPVSDAERGLAATGAPSDGPRPPGGPRRRAPFGPERHARPVHRRRRALAGVLRPPGGPGRHRPRVRPRTRVHPPRRRGRRRPRHHPARLPLRRLRPRLAHHADLVTRPQRAP
jgi:hypothetical protein